MTDIVIDAVPEPPVLLAEITNGCESKIVVGVPEISHCEEMEMPCGSGCELEHEVIAPPVFVGAHEAMLVPRVSVCASGE